MELSDQEKTTLLEIAKRAIVAKAGNREMPKLTADLPILKEKRGAFVTLKKRGHLRGCIGYIKAVKPLGETVQEMAVAAAFHDPRFPSVKSEEIRDLSFEISVLSPLQKIKNIDEKLDMLTEKIDTGFCDIGNTYVRKDTYSKDLKALTKESANQAKRIDAINKLMWFMISAVLIFVITRVLETGL